MGVAGSGKTTIGQKLAATLGWEFRDADEFHPASNIAKMSAGTPLTDEDREPWLAAIRRYVDDCLRDARPAVVTCSALRKAYRQTLGTHRSEVKLVYLSGSRGLISERLSHREGHFMRPAMLDSQFATLEPPQNAITVDVAASPEAIVAQIRSALSV